ncbi:DNA polymerase III alpha subunit [hydrothermal vent metagenome]|uniref:DNA polymerase III subunit alpha n=1 Tax=hydrothermal vent metagenome TaxID=652676 RepID=A0A3B1A0Y9_9ZZZZ
MQNNFVHLHLHSEYSISDGLIRLKPLIKATVAAAMPAIAVTDQNNMFAMVKFYRAAQAAGIKPIIGSELWLHENDDSITPTRIVLLCKDITGYRNMTHLISKCFMQGQRRGLPMLNMAWLEGYTDGLIALSGASRGNIGESLLKNNIVEAERLLQKWLALFPNSFYLELQRTGRAQEEDHLHLAIDLALKFDVPVVATNDVQFLLEDDFDAHEARVCINQGRTLDDPRRPKNYSTNQYLKSPAEMIELFSDIPEAIDNTINIAMRCNLELTLGKNFLPNYPIPSGMRIEDFLAQESKIGLEKRLQFLFDVTDPEFPKIRQVYDDRLTLELGVINQMGFPGYFLIVADFIKWAKQQLIPVGPGRGSGAGSLVAYALTITDLDPIKYELLFERFLNPERVSMPDFDIDFCMDGRDRVIEYVANTYGREKVSQIITYGSMAAKAVIRDAGRVLAQPYGFVDRLAKLIPFEIGITLDKALEQEDALRELYEQDDEVQELINLAKKLEGLKRNAGKHAGGVVIAPSKLTDFTPLYCEQDSSSIVTQLDKDDVEAVGLVKFDFLGLRTLTIIDWALQNVNKVRKLNGDELINIETIPLDDKISFDLLKASQTTAVFQLESRGMKDLIKRLQPDDFEDIIALVALFRPGPLQSGMVDDFINRKHGRAKVVYPHPDLEPILKPTYGVILYQEQVMQIAQILAGYTLGAADMLRRAMGKKKPEEMAKQRIIFTDGAVKNNVEETVATYIFDLMEKFAGYGFNKSHSAAYALVSYQTAWLKAHYPAEFMAAVLSADMENTDKVVILIDECRDMTLKVEAPNVNLCAHRFTVLDNHTIVYGLGAIKGVGEAAIDNISNEREQNGNYQDLFDLCRRIDLKKVNKRTFEGLIMAGALDVFNQTRSTLMATLGGAVKIAEQYSRNSRLGQNDLFGETTEVNDSGPGSYNIQQEWGEEQRLSCEKQTLGLYLTGHPINRYLEELSNFTSSRIVELKPKKDQLVVVAGLIIAIRTMNTRRGDRMAFITIDDRSARIELAVFSDVYERCQDNLAKDRLIVIEGEVSIDDYSGGYKISCRNIFDLDQARENFAKRLEVKLVNSNTVNGFVSELAQTLTPFKEGFCPVVVDYTREDAQAKLNLGQAWRVHPTEELLHRLKKLAGENSVKLIY